MLSILTNCNLVFEVLQVLFSSFFFSEKMHRGRGCQAQVENSNYDVLLSTLLVSMKICHKEISISIWHLSVHVKVHKESIRTKHETSEAYSELGETSKIKLFTKILNGFQLLTIVLII